MSIEPTRLQAEFIRSHQNLYSSALSQDYLTFSKIYVDKDQLIDDKKTDEDDMNKKGSKRDPLIRYLFKIQSIIWFYQNRDYNSFLKATDYRFKIKSVSDKRLLKAKVQELVEVSEPLLLEKL